MANWELGFGLDLGQLTSGIMNYFSQRETNKANRELAELAYQQNVEQWERENAYNHPAAQMSRLTEAGLNPNLVYGNGSAVQTSAHSPQMSYPQMHAPQLNISTPFTASPLNSAQQAVLTSQAELNAAKVIETIASSEYLGAQTKRELINNVTLGTRNNLAIVKAHSEIQVMNKQLEVMASQIDVNKSVVDLNNEQKNLVIENIRKVGYDADSAKSMYDYWYSKGMTPAHGWEQMIMQLLNSAISDGADKEPKELIPERYWKEEGKPKKKRWQSRDYRPGVGYSGGDWR